MRLLSRRRDRPGDVPAVIADPTDITVMDRNGAVRSIQGADVTLPADVLEDLWSPTYLERLARTYWRFLSRVTLGLIRVHYGPDERAVVFLRRPFVLLRFHQPEYELSPQRGIVRWRIRDGLLVSRRDEGYLEIDVRLLPSDDPGTARLHLEVEVANFYPAIATWLTRFAYKQTQSRIHVLVTYGFLRSLAKLELEESAVGRFAVPAGATNGNGRRPSPPAEDRTVGDTPWTVVAALVGGVLLGMLIAEQQWRGGRDLEAAREWRRRRG